MQSITKPRNVYGGLKIRISAFSKLFKNKLRNRAGLTLSRSDRQTKHNMVSHRQNVSKPFQNKFSDTADLRNKQSKIYITKKLTDIYRLQFKAQRDKNRGKK